VDSNKTYLDSLNMYLHVVGLPTSTVSVPKHKRYELQDLSRGLPGMTKRVDHPLTSSSCTDLHFSAGFSERLYDMVIHMNDDHRWTREQIADWIETLDDVPTF